MKLMTIALFVGLQGPLPTQLPSGQIATPAGIPGPVGLPVPTAAAQAGGPQQLPAVQVAGQQQVGITPFDVVVVDGELSELLALLAQSYGLNLSIDPEIITDTVSADLRGVSLEEALAILLDPRNLEYEIEGQVLRVRQPQTEERIFEFDYITTRRQLTRSLSASATAGGGGISTGTATAGGAGVGGGGFGGGASSSSLSGNEETDLLSDIETGLTALTSDEGSFVFNRMAGLIFATDFRRNLDMMGTYLETIQNAVNRQVMIEARIVEVKLNDDFQAGIDWTGVLGNTGIISQSFGAGQGGFNLSVTHENFTALLDALSRQGSVNVLQATHLSTMNNQPAILRVGTQDVFFTTTTQVDPRTGTIIQTAEIPATINEGVVLDVTPQISSNGVITMNIHPTVTERTGQATSSTGSSVPIVDVRETDVVTRVADGETVVLAGLISDRTLENVSQVPILGDIPLVGGLFRSVDNETRKTDMVILLSPRIMTIQDASDYALERIEQQEQLRRQLN